MLDYLKNVNYEYPSIETRCLGGSSPQEPGYLDIDLDIDSDSNNDIDSMKDIQSFNPVLSKPESSESRIQKAQSLWNSLDIKPAYNWLAHNRRPDDNTKLLHTLDGFSDELIEQAIHNYKKLIDMPDCDFMKYQSFPGFMYSGVEKFIDDARPFETLVRKKKPDSAKPTVDLSSRTGFSAMRQSTDENLDLLEGL
jgi:hypothetical protein